MKIERGSFKHYLLLVISMIILGIIIYPLLDFILCEFVYHSKFVYTVKDYILKPVMHGLCVGSGLFFIDISRK